MPVKLQGSIKSMNVDVSLTVSIIEIVAEKLHRIVLMLLEVQRQM